LRGLFAAHCLARHRLRNEISDGNRYQIQLAEYLANLKRDLFVNLLEEIFAEVHNHDMNEETTKNLPPNFEERVLARLEEIKTGLQDIDERAQRLEAKADDTKPMWKNALKEIADTRVEMREGFTEMREGFAKVAAEMRLMERKIEIVNKRWLNVEARVDELEDRLPEPELAL
jgi:uncharacterized coiled-coil DUF342 family protein